MKISFEMLTKKILNSRHPLLLFLNILSIIAFLSLQLALGRNLVIRLTEIFLQRQIAYSYWDDYLYQSSYYLLIFFFCSLIIIIFDVIKHFSRLISAVNEYLSSRRWLAWVVIIIPWLLIIGLFIQDNIDNPNFWFDESGQFWMAKGLNHYSEPNQAESNLKHVLINNSSFNKDPGGFTVLLHFWSMISNQPAFLRFLPLLFFILSMVLISKISVLLYPENNIAYFAGLILLFSGLLKKYAFELRPYSMEVFTTLLALYYCYKISQILSNRLYAFFTGISLALALTSRYAAFIAVGTLGLLILIEVLSKPTKDNFINFLLFSSPIMISSIMIYFFMLRTQIPKIEAPTYVTHLTIQSGNYKDIFLNQDAIKTFAPFFILIVLYVLSSQKGTFKKSKSYLTFSLIINGIFLVLSLTGKHPWAFTSKWDISTHALFIIALNPLGIALIDWITEQVIYPSIVSGLSIFLLIITSGILANKYNLNDEVNSSVFSNFRDCDILPNSKILANVNSSGTIRYLFEYGPLKMNDQIYQNISFFDDRHHQKNQNSWWLNDIYQFDYVILGVPPL